MDSVLGSKNPEELLDNLKLELFSEEVFVLTPKGDLVVLPKGATPVDFAYHIHTDIGNHSAGAKDLKLRFHLPKSKPVGYWYIYFQSFLCYPNLFFSTKTLKGFHTVSYTHLTLPTKA